MNLIIDIGNTRVKLAVFRNEDLQKKWIWKKLEGPRLFRLIKREKVKQVALSSTRGIDETLVTQLRNQIPVLILDAKNASADTK